MARPARPERSRSARSSRQLSRFYHSINPDRVFGTHRSILSPPAILSGKATKRVTSAMSPPQSAGLLRRQARISRASFSSTRSTRCRRAEGPDGILIGGPRSSIACSNSWTVSKGAKASSSSQPVMILQSLTAPSSAPVAWTIISLSRFPMCRL
jgi:hypothetical protein